MMIKTIVIHSLIFTTLFNGFLFLMMISFNPRIWGYSDYPQIVKDKVPAQTSREKRTALMVSIPFLLITIGYPIYSVLALKSSLGEDFNLWIGFLNLYSMFIMAGLVDTIILDWLIISTLTPDFVVIEGSDKNDYKDFRYHYIATAKAALIMIPVLLAVAWLIEIL